MRSRYWSRGLTVSGLAASATLARASEASRTRSSTSPSLAATRPGQPGIIEHLLRLRCQFGEQVAMPTTTMLRGAATAMRWDTAATATIATTAARR